MRDEDRLGEHQDTLQQVLNIVRASHGQPPKPEQPPPPPELPLTPPPSPTPPPPTQPDADKVKADEPDIWTSVRRETAKLLGTDFLEEGRASLQQKLYYGGVMLAAVAFETRLRDLAARLEIDTKQPAIRILNELVRRVENKSFIEQMRTLLRLRNVILHGDRYQDSFDAEAADEVFSAFEDGFNKMQEVAYRHYL